MGVFGRKSPVGSRDEDPVVSLRKLKYFSLNITHTFDISGSLTTKRDYTGNENQR